MLTLSRKHSEAWHAKFVKVLFSHDVFKRVPDGWKYKGKLTLDGLGFHLHDGVLRIMDMPSDEASFRRLIVAVRHVLERTNIAEPAEDPPPADDSLTSVLEEVFRLQRW